MTEKLTIISFGAGTFAGTPAQAAKLMAAIAPLREVERPDYDWRRPWEFTGQGASGAFRTDVGEVQVRQPKPKAKAPQQLRLTQQPLAIGFDGGKP